MMAPAWARPPPVSLPGAALIWRTAANPTQKAAGPSSTPKGQISTTAAIPKISAIPARASTTGGPDISCALAGATRTRLVRIIAVPRPPVAAAAAAPTTSRPMNAARPGRYGPHFHPDAIEANKRETSKALPATNRAPITFTRATSVICLPIRLTAKRGHHGSSYGTRGAFRTRGVRRALQVSPIRTCDARRASRDSNAHLWLGRVAQLRSMRGLRR